MVLCSDAWDAIQIYIQNPYFDISWNCDAKECSVCLNYDHITLSLQNFELPRLIQGCVDVDSAQLQKPGPLGPFLLCLGKDKYFQSDSAHLRC